MVLDDDVKVEIYKGISLCRGRYCKGFRLSVRMQSIYSYRTGEVRDQEEGQIVISKSPASACYEGQSKIGKKTFGIGGSRLVPIVSTCPA